MGALADTLLRAAWVCPVATPPLKDGWVAVRAMIPAKQAQRIMDALWEAGADAILVTKIHACRL